MDFRTDFDAFFYEEDASGLPPGKDDEQKRREVCQKDAKSFPYPQSLKYITGKGVITMVELIVGNKGSGKTKTLIDRVNKAAEVSKGNVVCIERGDSLKFDLGYQIRLIDIKEYQISGSDAYYGFIAGLLAGNYDITEIFGDATFKILCGKDSKDFEALAKFVEKVDALSPDGPDITFTVSCDVDDLPDRLSKYIKK